MTRKLNEGDVYMGKITRIIDIGAFVEVLPGKEGMIHISQLAEHRVGKVEDEVAVGDEIVVRIRGFDQKGRLNLTRLGIHPEQVQHQLGKRLLTKLKLNRKISPTIYLHSQCRNSELKNFYFAGFEEVLFSPNCTGFLM